MPPEQELLVGPACKWEEEQTINPGPPVKNNLSTKYCGLSGIESLPEDTGFVINHTIYGKYCLLMRRNSFSLKKKCDVNGNASLNF